MSNFGLEKAFRKNQIEFERAGVGDRYVLEKLHQNNWVIGGENSGHIICLDKHSTGDGIISALQVLAAVVSENQTLKQLCNDLNTVPQVLINVPVKSGYDFNEDDAITTAIAKIKKQMGDNGRLLLRASGTEDVIRVMVEGEDAKFTKKSAESLAALIRNRSA